MSIKRRLANVENKLTPSNEVCLFLELDPNSTDSVEERKAKAWQKHLDSGGNPEDKPLYFVEIDPTQQSSRQLL